MKKRLVSLMLTVFMLAGLLQVTAKETYFSDVDFAAEMVNDKMLFQSGSGSEVVTDQNNVSWTVLADGSGSKIADDVDGGSHQINNDTIESDVSEHQFAGIRLANQFGLTNDNRMDKYLCFDVKIDGRPKIMRAVFCGKYGEFANWKFDITAYPQNSDGYYTVALPLSGITNAQDPSHWSQVDYIRLLCWGEWGKEYAGTMSLKSIVIKRQLVSEVTTGKEFKSIKEYYKNGKIVNIQKTGSAVISEDSLFSGPAEIKTPKGYDGVELSVSLKDLVTDENRDKMYISADVKQLDSFDKVRLSLVSGTNGWTEHCTNTIDIKQAGVDVGEGFFNIKIPMTEFKGISGSEWNAVYGLRISSWGEGYGENQLKDSSYMYLNHISLLQEDGYERNVQNLWKPYGSSLESGNRMVGTKTGVTVAEEEGSIKMTAIKAYVGVELMALTGEALKPIGLTAENMPEAALRFSVKHASSSDKMLRVMFCTNPYSIDSSTAFGAWSLTINNTDDWQEVSIPLSGYGSKKEMAANVKGISIQSGDLGYGKGKISADNPAIIYLKDIRVELAREKVMRAELSVMNADRTAEITEAAPGETVNAVVSYANGFQNRSQKLTLVLAVYDADEKLVSYEIQRGTAGVFGDSSSAGALESSYTIPDSTAGYVVKAMLWDDLNTLVPLTRDIKVN